MKRLPSSSSLPLVLESLLLGAGVILAILVTAPELYLGIADRFRWRLGLPEVRQVQLESTIAHVQLRGDEIAGNNATLLFGDSHLQGLPASSLGAFVTNYAIAGEPASRLAARIGRYASLKAARRVVLLSGSNDLARGNSPEATADAMVVAMDQVPAKTPVLLVEVPPLRGDLARSAAVLAFNAELAKRCRVRQGCQLIPLPGLADVQGQLRADYADSDGIHLSAGGYRVLAEAINEALQKNQP